MTTDIVDDASYMHDPMGRVRFFGIYEGTVIDIKDPKKQNRVKVKVHQVTGQQVSGWAEGCQPITSVANHPDHQEHTAAQIAALLTTTSISVTDSRGDTETIPALTVVAKAGAGTLKHPRKTAANTTQRWNDAQEINTVAEHTPHRLVPKVGQKVWIMFKAGDPEYPVWIGVK
jgi:hypothetical protein